MLTIETLQSYGANTSEGLARCLNNEAFYLRLVGMALADDGSAVKSDDHQAAFEAAHGLKGVLGNLALTPLYERASQITELLRAGQEADYVPMAEELIRKRDELTAAAG